MASTCSQLRKAEKNALWLYFYFLRVGAITFGSGGMLVVLQVKRDFVERYHWMSEDELWDMYSVGRSLPGLMISDVVCILGYSLYGIAGSIAAILGIATVPMISIVGVVLFYNAFHDNYWIAAVLSGIRAVVLPIILSGALSMIKGAYKHRICYAVTILSLILYCVGFSVIFIILVDAICGLLIGRFGDNSLPDGVEG